VKEVSDMATAKKKPASKPSKPVRKTAASKASTRPVSRKPARPAPRPSRPTAKPAPKPAAKPTAKAVAKPAVKVAAKAPSPSPARPAAKAPAKPVPKGAAAPKAAAPVPAPKPGPTRLVPATPAAKAAALAAQQKGTKGSSRSSGNIVPLGVLPPENMARSKPLPKSAPVVRVIAKPRPAAPAPARPAPADAKLTKKDLEYFERRLQQEHARLMREMGHLETTVLNQQDGENSIYSSHMGDAGTDSMDREISFDLASKEGRLLLEVKDALKRLYEGRYGICEASGQPIARARLEALPWVRLTVAEQEKLERKRHLRGLIKAEEDA
jgi:RNA polymerase-binding transcription factor DksA